jgi:hypothetical protein
LAIALVVVGCADGRGASVWLTSDRTDIYHVVMGGNAPGEAALDEFQLDVPPGAGRTAITFESLDRGDILVYKPDCTLELEFTLPLGESELRLPRDGLASLVPLSSRTDAAGIPHMPIKCGRSPG